MSENVIAFPGTTTADIPAAQVLQAAIDQGMEDVLVIGWTNDGDLYAATSGGSVGDNLLLLELAKRNLVEGMFSE